MNITEVRDIFIGTDIVEISRIRSSINRTGQRFLDRIYTLLEQKYCTSKSRPEIHYAGRFAAKEAVIKALKSSGYTKTIPFKAIDIRSGDHGEPIIVLDFDCDGKCKVSISHTNTHAIASAIFISE